MSSIISNVEELATFLNNHHLTWQEAHLPDKEWLASLTFPLRLPTAYAELINWRDPQDPLRQLVIPNPQEDHISEYELNDPIGDTTREAVPGLIHRYPDRCLLLLTTHCLVHCRFCFRREVVGKVRPVAFTQIGDYLRQHTEIHEIIFSGGDPGSFPAGFLQTLGRELGNIPHIHRWRVHTRLPIVDPESITTEWLDALCALPGQKTIALHIDHPRELTSQVRALIQELLSRKILVLSQTVLLKGVNTQAALLKELFENLVSTGVKPYYLHHLDKAKGTSHFRISIKEGMDLYRQLRGHLSSICLPEYVLDLPGGNGKIPIMWLTELSPGRYQTTTFEKKVVVYEDPSQTT